MLKDRLPTTHGLPKACNVLASPINKNEFVVGLGRKVIRFDGSENEYIPKERDPEFLKVVDNELSKDAALLIYKKYILTVKELLERIQSNWFQQEAGQQVFEELQALIDRKGWKKEET